MKLDLSSKIILKYLKVYFWRFFGPPRGQSPNLIGNYEKCLLCVWATHAYKTIIINIFLNGANEEFCLSVFKSSITFSNNAPPKKINARSDR